VSDLTEGEGKIHIRVFPAANEFDQVVLIGGGSGM